MATQSSANVYVTNNMGGTAEIILFHKNETYGTQTLIRIGEPPGSNAGPLKVLFPTDWWDPRAWVYDYWSVLVHVLDGPQPGLYVNEGTTAFPYWKECQLQSKDADKTLTFSVSPTSFNIALVSGACQDTMKRLLKTYQPITHVFVVMLENHSFDNIFAMSRIPGITAATTQSCNTAVVNGAQKTFYVQPTAPARMSTDPGHEFADVVQQLTGRTGQGAYPSGGPYPPINNSGFAANYATSTTEVPHQPPDPSHINDIMACFETQRQLPALYQLATEFAVCDHWFSSMPGPTWPNRFFIHCASSAYWDDSPSDTWMKSWELNPSGISFPKGSIYDALRNAGILYRFYNDAPAYPGLDKSMPLGHSLFSDDPNDGSIYGAIPQVAALAGVSKTEFYSLSKFADHLQGPYPYPYTFIEPHYGDIWDGTYKGGSSQHPMDNVTGGERLLAAVYSAIRNSPYWWTSLLIITYDEHGGIYDSVSPGPALAPGDPKPNNYNDWNKHGFDFEQYGVRVPAVVVSPLIPKGKVDHTVYDHSSVPKTLEKLFGLPPLTNRDQAANDLITSLVGQTSRDDCPTSITPPASMMDAAVHLMMADEGAQVTAKRETEARAQRLAQPLPNYGNLLGWLTVLAKTDFELSAGTPEDRAAIQSKLNSIQTREQAEAYAESVMAKVETAHQERELAAAQAVAGTATPAPAKRTRRQVTAKASARAKPKRQSKAKHSTVVSRKKK